MRWVKIPPWVGCLYFEERIKACRQKGPAHWACGGILGTGVWVGASGAAFSSCKLIWLPGQEECWVGWRKSCVGAQGYNCSAWFSGNPCCGSWQKAEKNAPRHRLPSKRGLLWTFSQVHLYYYWHHASHPCPPQAGPHQVSGFLIQGLEG